MATPSHSWINTDQPQLIHVDLNSAFAMIEQQANPLLRGKPVAMTNRLTRGATIIAASYEAKRFGVGVGTKLGYAQELIPNLVALETDPAKYIHAYRVFSKIITSYSPNAHMKSIDEGIIDFSNVASVRQPADRPLEAIGYEIKARLKEELGEWITCNIGIAPNRFLAKLAAGLHKPNGLDIIDHKNLLDTYSQLRLTDLHGINRRYQARLNFAGIFSPLDLFHAGRQKLAKEAFRSINGDYWYLRLRGWEVDAAQTSTKTIGRQYVLHNWTAKDSELAPILMKMCEGMGRRLRTKGLCARGIYLHCWFVEGGGWKARKKFKTRLYSTPELYAHAWALFAARPKRTVKTLAVSCYGLEPADTKQLNLFETGQEQNWRLTKAVDELNNRYGEFVVYPGLMANTNQYVKEKIPFGTTKHFPSH